MTRTDIILTVFTLILAGIGGELLGPYVTRFLEFSWEKICRMMHAIRNLTHKPSKKQGTEK